jgi:hypothetical protein
MINDPRWDPTRVQDRIAVDRRVVLSSSTVLGDHRTRKQAGGKNAKTTASFAPRRVSCYKKPLHRETEVAEPPPILGKSKEIGVLMWAPAPDVLYRLSVEAALRRTPDPHDNRTLFIEAMPDPVRRRVAFDVVERNCRQWLGEGEEGVRLYGQLLNYVRQANVVRAVSEFQQRFLPMLDQQYLRQRGREARRTTRNEFNGRHP